MTISVRYMSVAALAIASLQPAFANGPGTPVAAPTQAEAKFAALEKQIADLQARLEREEAASQVRKIAFSYGYFLDNGQLEHIRSMFADKMEYCEASGYGRYNGRAGCDTMFSKVLGYMLREESGMLRFGLIPKHYMIKDIVDVSPDGKTAVGRFDYLGMGGTYGRPDRAGRQMGIYRMGFVKEDGVWKLSRFSLTFEVIDADFAGKWTVNPAMRCPPSTVPKPDEPYAYYHPFPETGVVPFETRNPVTGEIPTGFVNPKRYWEGNWPGEFGKKCGKRADAPEPVIRESKVPTAR